MGFFGGGTETYFIFSANSCRKCMNMQSLSYSVTSLKLFSSFTLLVIPSGCDLDDRFRIKRFVVAQSNLSWKWLS